MTTAKLETPASYLEDPAYGLRLRGDCPVCGGSADLVIDWMPRCNDGKSRWLYLCNHCPRDNFAGELCVELRVSKSDLFDGHAPIEGLHLVSSAGGPPRGLKPLPSEAQCAGYASALFSCERAMDYLLRGRGVSDKVIREQGIGWDQDRHHLVLPLRHDGEIVNAKTRAIGKGHKTRTWAGNGRPYPLYPEPTHDQGWVLILAGEFDALAGRSVGLPVSSVTNGAGNWKPSWTEQLAALGVPVIVMFDNSLGERQSARSVVQALKDAGVNARRFDLAADFGYKTRSGDLCSYLAVGSGPRAKRRLANEIRSLVFLKEGSR